MNRAVEWVQKGKWREKEKNWRSCWQIPHFTLFCTLWSKMLVYRFSIYQNFVFLSAPYSSWFPLFFYFFYTLSHAYSHSFSCLSFLFIVVSWGEVLLIEILYRVSMGIVNFVERERKTARVNGWKGEKRGRESGLWETLRRERKSKEWERISSSASRTGSVHFFSPW